MGGGGRGVVERGWNESMFVDWNYKGWINRSGEHRRAQRMEAVCCARPP
jgi:hypothetical protein